MSVFTDASSLIFFKAEEYIYNKSNIFDASVLPRPHYCIGLILSGEAIFRDSMSGESVQVRSVHMGSLSELQVTIVCPILIVLEKHTHRFLI